MVTDQGIMFDKNAVVDYRHDLISTRKVEGRPVFGEDGQKLGKVHSLMIGKRDGKVAYAVLAFGGFLHLGEHVHPIPWDLLSYDIEKRGYVIGLNQKQLEQVPSFILDQDDRPVDRDYQEQLNSYWTQTPWWGL